MGKDFYDIVLSPKVIGFTRRQCLWLIWHLPELQNGDWPVDAATYDLYIGKVTVKSKAYFTTPVEYAAEIESRLERAGLDGLVLLCIECFDMSRASLAAYFRVSEWVMTRRRKRALTFVSGWVRKMK